MNDAGKKGCDTDLRSAQERNLVDDVVTSDYYSQLPQIRLTGSPTDRPMQPETPTEVTLDGNDVAKLVECASASYPNIRYVEAAIWITPTVPDRFSSLVLRRPRFS